MEDSPDVRRLVVLGLGLMGGSFAKAVRQARIADTIVGYDCITEIATAALSDGTIDTIAETPRAAVAGADMVILATPVRAILSLLEEIAPALALRARVLDLGSTKRQIVAAMNLLPASVEAVGGHPMVGKTPGGWAAADATLFRDATFVLCPTERTPAVAGNWAEALVRAIGAKPLILDPVVHDQAVSRVSHLPYILSATLVRAVRPTGVALQLAAGGYRDTSRVSAHEPTMMGDILLTNRDNILSAIRAAKSILEGLETALESSDEFRVKDWIRQVKGKA